MFLLFFLEQGYLYYYNKQKKKGTKRNLFFASSTLDFFERTDSFVYKKLCIRSCDKDDDVGGGRGTSKSEFSDSIQPLKCSRESFQNQ